MGYKCESCGTIKQAGESYYQVKIITADGKMRFVPTCSEKCAKDLRDKYYRLHKNRAGDIKYQCFQFMKWED